MSARVPHTPLIRWSLPTPRRMQKGDTALTMTSIHKKWDTVRLLAARKADPNIADAVKLINGVSDS